MAGFGYKNKYYTNISNMRGGEHMKKLFTSLLVLSVLFATSGVPALAHAGKTPKPASHIVCIDPGHGGTDTGATMTDINGTITEANENLQVATDLENLLTSAGVQWVATRTTDVTLSNADRYNFCNSQGAGLELSIHMNGSTNHAIDYTEVLYGKQTKDLAWAQTLDSAMANLSAATGPGTIQNNGVTNYADGVLLKSNMPAALAETVFITSLDEYNLLTDGTGNRQQAIAQQLENGVLTWLSTH